MKRYLIIEVAEKSIGRLMKITNWEDELEQLKKDATHKLSQQKSVN